MFSKWWLYIPILGLIKAVLDKENFPTNFNEGEFKLTALIQAASFGVVVLYIMFIVFRNLVT